MLCSSWRLGQGFGVPGSSLVVWLPLCQGVRRSRRRPTNAHCIQLGTETIIETALSTGSCRPLRSKDPLRKQWPNVADIFSLCILLPQHHYLHHIHHPQSRPSPPLTPSSLRPEQRLNTRQPQMRTFQLARASFHNDHRLYRLHMTGIMNPVRKALTERRQAVRRHKGAFLVQFHVEL